jgi:hypothetical protein
MLAVYLPARALNQHVFAERAGLVRIPFQELGVFAQAGQSMDENSPLHAPPQRRVLVVREIDPSGLAQHRQDPSKIPLGLRVIDRVRQR